MNAPTPNVSFIGIVDFSQEARWIYMTDSVTELLGFEPHDLIGRPSLELVHPDEFPRVRQLHYDTIQQDKAAVLVYLRMRHKDPYRGYVLCGVVGAVLLLLLHLTLIAAPSVARLSQSRTVVHNVLVGSVSFASPAKALHNASTAQEITVITPSAQNLSFRRWHDPSPMPPSPIPESMALPASPTPSASTSTSSSWGRAESPRSSPSPRRRSPDENGNTRSHAHGNGASSPLHRRPSPPGSSPSRTPSPSGQRLVRPPVAGPATTPRPERAGVITFDPLSNKSFRTAFILNRFTVNATILYCSNDLLISTTDAIGRNFYDFVAEKDEEKVRSWIQCVKGWGVNESGQPSDGGFGFGRFNLLAEGRDSVKRMPDPPTPSRKNGRRHNHHHPRHGHETRGRGGTRYMISASRVAPPPPTPHTSPLFDTDQFEVDAIFSAHSDGMVVILRRAS